jgi:hypothetical protein
LAEQLLREEVVFRPSRRRRRKFDERLWAPLPLADPDHHPGDPAATAPLAGRVARQEFFLDRERAERAAGLI